MSVQGKRIDSMNGGQTKCPEWFNHMERMELNVVSRITKLK